MTGQGTALLQDSVCPRHIACMCMSIYNIQIETRRVCQGQEQPLGSPSLPCWPALGNAVLMGKMQLHTGSQKSLHLLFYQCCSIATTGQTGETGCQIPPGPISAWLRRLLHYSSIPSLPQPLCGSHCWHVCSVKATSTGRKGKISRDVFPSAACRTGVASEEEERESPHAQEWALQKILHVW